MPMLIEPTTKDKTMKGNLNNAIDADTSRGQWVEDIDGDRVIVFLRDNDCYDFSFVMRVHDDTLAVIGSYDEDDVIAITDEQEQEITGIAQDMYNCYLSSDHYATSPNKV